MILLTRRYGLGTGNPISAYYHQVRKSVHAYLSLVEADFLKKLQYTVKETASILEVLVPQVYRLIKNKKLSVLNLGPRGNEHECSRGFTLEASIPAVIDATTWLELELELY